MSANPYARYQEAALLTASPAELVVLLYDGAIKACSAALVAIRDKQVMRANAAFIKAQSIIAELRRTLDLGQGELSAHLDALYLYMQNRLIEANLRKDPAMTAEVQALLQEMRGAWAQAGKTGERCRKGDNPTCR